MIDYEYARDSARARDHTITAWAWAIVTLTIWLAIGWLFLSNI